MGGVGGFMTTEQEDQLIAKTQGYLDINKTKEAEETAEELAQMDPKDAIVWYLKGKVHYSAGEYDEALSALSKAAQIQNDHPDIWLVIGYTLIAQRRYQEAIQSLEYVKAVRPENVEAYAALGILHSILGNLDESKKNLKEALRIDRHGACVMLENFYKQFIASSPAIEKSTKELVKNLIEKARVAP
jgi:tetratricopeptide (TPR) repeat protein